MYVRTYVHVTCTCMNVQVSTRTYMSIWHYMYPMHKKNPTPNMYSRALLSSFAASIGLMYCSRAQKLDHGCSGEGRLATRMTTQRFSRPMPLLRIAAPLTTCKLWLHFVLCTQMAVYKLFDMWIARAWAYAMFLCEFIWTTATVLFMKGFFDAYCTCTYM